MIEKVKTFVKENIKRIFVKDWIKNNHNEIYNELFNWSNNHNIDYTTISELIFIYINQLTNKPLCKLCNENNTKFINITAGYRIYCSTKCQANDVDIKNKKENTCLQKYDSINPFASLDIQNKAKNSIKEKYGVDNISQLDNIKKQKEETTLINYGVSHHSKLDINKEIYSKNIINNKEKLLQGVIDKYNVTNISNVQIYQDKKIQTFNKKSYLRLKEKYKDYDVILFNNAFDICFKSNECNHEFNIQEQLFDLRLKNKHTVCTICNPIIKQFSQLEKDIVSYLKQFNIQIQENVNNLIPDRKLELDIYLPDYKIGIEVNGIHWHSELYKDKNYHINKRKLFSKEDITLIQIWEDDWMFKSDIIKSIIKTHLKLNNNKIFARKCILKKINKQDEQLFLNSYHLQGYSKSDYCVGLYYNNELISLMSFIKPRLGIGNKNNNEYELLRYCVKDNYNIIGGGSKLFQNFFRENNNPKIYSFCDTSYFTGDLYLKLNMKFVNETLDYYYIVNGIKENRLKFMKHKLVKEGFDNKLTEHEIMFNRGYYRLYGSGISKYEVMF